MGFIDEIEGLVSSQFNVIKEGLLLTRLEARLALLSIYPLIINVCLLFVMLVSTWLVMMGMLGYGLMQYVDSVLLALSGVLMVNILLLGLLFRYLVFNLKSMSFEKTRAYLRGGHELKKAGDDGNSHKNQAIVEPTEPAQ